jgi:PTS system galactosamine-specific IIC component
MLLVGFICSIDQQTEAFYWFRPMVASFFTGIVLGDVQLGVQCGAVAELAYLGMTNVGGTVPPDPLFAGIMTVVLAYTTGQTPEAALGLSYPFALLAQALGILFKTLYSFVPHKLDAYAAEGNVKSFNGLIVAVTVLQSLVFGVVIFLCVYALQAPIQAFVNAFPTWVTHGFEIAGGVLPAVGLAMLLLTTLKPETYPYLFIGFIVECVLANIVTSDGTAVFANVLPVAVLGTALAAINYAYEKKIDETAAKISSVSNGGDSDGI